MATGLVVGDGGRLLLGNVTSLHDVTEAETRYKRLQAELRQSSGSVDEVYLSSSSSSYLTLNFILMLQHALHERLCMAPLNRLPYYGALEVIVSLLHCTLATAQCIVIGPVCGFVCGCVCVCGWVVHRYHDAITRNCVHQSSPNCGCK